MTPRKPGRPPRAGTPSRVRPGPPMTDAEYAPVLALAAREGIDKVEAMRRLIAAGAQAMGVA